MEVLINREKILDFLDTIIFLYLLHIINIISSIYFLGKVLISIYAVYMPLLQISKMFPTKFFPLFPFLCTFYFNELHLQCSKKCFSLLRHIYNWEANKPRIFIFLNQDMTFRLIILIHSIPFNCLDCTLIKTKKLLLIFKSEIFQGIISQQLFLK